MDRTHTPHVSHSSLSTYVFPCGGWYGWRCKGRSSIPEVGTKLPGSPFSPLGPGCPVPGRDRTGQITLNHLISTHYCVYIIPRLFPVPGLFCCQYSGLLSLWYLGKCLNVSLQSKHFVLKALWHNVYLVHLASQRVLLVPEVLLSYHLKLDSGGV